MYSNSEYQRLFVFSNVCMQVKLANILTYVPILSYKNGVDIS